MSQAVPIPPRLLRCPALLPGLRGAPGCPCGVSYPPAAPAGSAGRGAGASGTQGCAAGDRAKCSGTGRWQSGGEDVGSISAHRQRLQSRFRWDWGDKKGRSHPGRSHPTPRTSLPPAEHLFGPASNCGCSPVVFIQSAPSPWHCRGAGPAPELPAPTGTCPCPHPGHSRGDTITGCCQHPSPFPDLLHSLLELMRCGRLLLPQQHPELLQGLQPLPQEGAGSMLQLAEPLHKERGPQPVGSPQHVTQAQQGISHIQSPRCRLRLGGKRGHGGDQHRANTAALPAPRGTSLPNQPSLGTATGLFPTDPLSLNCFRNVAIPRHGTRRWLGEGLGLDKGPAPSLPPLVCPTQPQTHGTHRPPAAPVSCLAESMMPFVPAPCPHHGLSESPC